MNLSFQVRVCKWKIHIHRIYLIHPEFRTIKTQADPGRWRKHYYVIIRLLQLIFQKYTHYFAKNSLLLQVRKKELCHNTLVFNIR